MNVLDMTCPKCGATMALDEDKGKAECAYCGYRKLIEKKDMSCMMFLRCALL